MIGGSWTRAVASRAIAMVLAGCWVGGCTQDEEPAASECEDGADGTCRRNEALQGCFCPAIYDPVCGKDGKTYGNACEAGCADVPVAHEGECKPAVDAGGACICPAIFKPVCGEDGKTYGNSCEASCAGVPVAHEGECADSGCGEATCESNAECTGGAICYPPTGQCQPACEIACLVYEPVCGTDGVTYGCGEADAHCHGAEVAYPGECKSTCACTKEYQPVCGVDGETYANRCLARCAGVEIAYEGSCSACESDEQCPHGYCDRGVTCTAIGCPPPPPNKCTVCGDGSELLCLALPAPCPDGQVREVVNSCYGACVDRFTCAPGGGGCSYEGQDYQPGERFPASDGCNTCTCGAEGGIACTEKACACDYTGPTRRWVARSPAQCATVRFICEPGLRPFFDDCGCGCEPDTATTCSVAGCSGQLCVGPGDPGVSTCEWRDEYACYRTASCEAQADGRCGWTKTEELRRCLEAARSGS